MSIRLKLTFWYTGILALVFLLFGITLYFFLSYSLFNEQRGELKAYGEQVNDAVRLVNFFGFMRIELPDLDAFQSSGTFLQAINVENREVTTSSNLMGREMPFAPDVLDKMRNEAKGFYETMELNDYSFLVYYQPLSFDGTLVGVLQVSRIVDDTEQFLQNIRIILVFAGLFTIGLAASVGWFLARKTLQPIEHVIEATRRIQNSDDLSTKISYAGPADEIGRLTDTINGMLTRIRQSYYELAESIHAQRRFVADASHELRTPLTTIRGNVDLLRKIWSQSTTEDDHDSKQSQIELTNEALSDIAAEAERMTRLVNDMLILARADAGAEMKREPLPMASLMDDVVRKASYFPRQVNWQIGDLTALLDVYVSGNRDYLQQLFFIFIENAFKYTQEGSVSLDAQRSDGQIGIRISDSGIGLDKEEIPLIFERFYRADPSRGRFAGTGLGLSIARRIIDEHDGSVEVMSSKGEGTTFIIWLPLCEAPLAVESEMRYNEVDEQDKT